jgi:hypothetical protein
LTTFEMFGHCDVVGLGDCYNELRRITLFSTHSGE